jgi:hypothetical protein
VSKLTDSFASVGIHNGWLYAKGNVAISYTPAQGSGAWREAAKWQVDRGTYRTDDAPRDRQHWRNGGRKTFTVGNEAAKAPQLEAAKTWASERYGIKEWAKTPYGDWMDAEFVAKRTAELKAAVKAQAAQEVADASR